MSQPLSLLFANPQNEDARRWYSQGLTFSPILGDVLVQQKGGPCGVLAALQAHILLYMTFLGIKDPKLALVESIYEIIERANKAPSSEMNGSAGNKLALFSRKDITAKGPFNPVEELIVETFDDPEAAKVRIGQLLDTQWATEAGIMFFVLSLIVSRGSSRVRSDMDDPEAYMTGQFGHCGQEMLNLIITGQASSQVHDGTVELADSGLHLRGVSARPRVGLLTRLEALRYCQVGSFLKSPEFPIWIIGSESHFTVLYSPDRDCDKKSFEQEIFERGKRAFTSKDTQENGFVRTTELPGVLQELGFIPQNESDERKMRVLVNKCEMPGSEGIAIWSTFWPIIGPLMREKKTLASLADPAWPCAACTYLNEDLDGKSCVVCFTPRSPESIQERERTKQQEQQKSAREASVPWNCATCTLRNNPQDQTCQACGASKTASMSMQAAEMETERGGRQFELIHVDGLQKTIGGQVHPPKKTKLKLTTVDSFLAGPGSSGFGTPFEEVLQTKWPGAVFDYGPGGNAPSIEG